MLGEDFEVNVLEDKLPSIDERFLGKILIEGFVKINKRIMFSKLRVKNIDVIGDITLTALLMWLMTLLLTSQ